MVQRVGVQIVIEGSGNFNASVQSFVSGIGKMNSATASIAGKTMTSMSGASNSVGIFGKSWERITDIITGVSIVGVFRSIINWVGSMKSEVLDAVGIFQLLEIRLERMAAIKMSYVLDIPVLDVYAQHMDDISASAEDLMMWIRRLAVSTPFSAESIAQAVALAQAFGFTENEAKVLTVAVGDFTAGMGLTNDQLHRILYNFGQMQSTGKVMGRQLYNLGQNLVPVKTIIQEMADQAGISFNEMKTAMQKGIVSADQFIAKFIELSNTKFTGAMEMSVQTLPAVIQNIHDFIQTLIGLEVFGPVFKRLAIVMNDFLQAAFNPEVIRFFDAIGKTLAMAFDIIYGAVQAVIPTIKTFFSVLGIGAPTALGAASAILKLAIGIKFFIQLIGTAVGAVTHFLALIQNKLGMTFSEMSSNMFAWGANIIAAFAQGMAAALKFVIKVLTTLAGIITRLLKGGSPPKLLPDLSWWGNQAMQAYLDGWASADFDVFDDISDTIYSYLKALGDKIPEEDLIPRIIGTRTAIAAAMDIVNELGYITEKALNDIMKAAGLTSESIKDYIRDLINLQAVTLNVGAAQDILSFNIDTVGEISTIFGKTITDLAGLAEAAKKLTGDLGVAVRDYVAKLYTLKDANDAAAEAEDNLSKITKYYDDTLKDLNDQLKGVTEVYDENIRLAEIQAALDTGLLTTKEKERLENEKKALMLKKTIRLTEEERDKAIGSAEDILDTKQKAVKEAEDAAEIQKRLAEELSKIQLAAAKEQYDAAKALVDLQTENNQLLSDQIDLLKRLAEALKGAGGATEEFDLGFDWPDLGAGVEGIGDTMQAALDELQARLQKQFDDFIASLTEPFAGVIGLLDTLFVDIDNVFESFVENPSVQNVLDSITGFADNMKITWELLKKFWDENGDSISESFGSMIESIGKILTPVFMALLDSLAIAIDVIGQGIVILAALLVENGPKISKAFEDLAKWFKDLQVAIEEGKFWEFLGFRSWDEGIASLSVEFANFMNGLVENFNKWVVDFLAGIIQWGIDANANFVEWLATILSGIIQWCVDSIQNFVDWCNELVGKSVIPDALSQMWDSFVEWLGKILASIVQWATDTLASVTQWIVDIKAEFVQWATDTLAGIVQWGIDTKAKFVQWITDTLADIVQWGTDLKATFVEWLGKILIDVGQWITDTIAKIVESFPTWIQTGVDIIVNFLKGLKDTFFAPGTGVIDKMKQYIQDVIDAIVKKIDDWKTLGKDIITAIIDGLKENAQKLVEYLTGIITTLIASILKLLGIGPHSPLFAGVGVAILEDILGGISNHARDFTDKLTSSIMDATSGAEMKINTSGILDLINQNTVGAVTPSYGNTVSNNNTRNVTIAVNPNYSNYQSEASIYYDISAALHAVNL